MSDYSSEVSTRSSRSDVINPPHSELEVTDGRTLTGGRAGLADVGERAVDRLLGLVSMFPQQDEADLLS